MRHRRRSFWLRLFGYHGLSGNEETGDRGRILQCRAHDLGGIDDALLHEVAIFAGLGVVAEGIVALVEDLAGLSRVPPTSRSRHVRFAPKRTFVSALSMSALCPLKIPQEVATI